MTASAAFGVGFKRRALFLDRLGAVAAMAVVAMSAAESLTKPEDAASPRAGLASSFAPAPPAGETMIGAYGGAPYTYPSDVQFGTPGGDFTARDVTWDGKPFEEPIYYGARLIRWLPGGGFGAMLDFTHSKTIARLEEEKEFSGALRGAPAPARSTLDKIFHKLEFSHGHNMLTLNGLMRLPRLGGPFFPYVGAGGGVTLPHTEIDIRNEKGRTYEYQFAGFVGQALAGVEIRLPRVSLFVEYKFSLAPYRAPLSLNDSKATLFEDVWRQLSIWWGGSTPGYAETTLASHQVISGLAVRFGAPSPVAAP